MSYTTEAKIESYLGTSVDATLAAMIISWVTAWINKYTGKVFEAVSETRYYDGNGRESILVDSFVGSPAVTVLNTDGTTDVVLTEGQADDFIVAPYNSTEKFQLILSSSGRYCAWPKGAHRIKVVASFGVSNTVPADIEMVATKLASSLITNASAAGGAVKSQSLGDYSVTYGDLDATAKATGVTETLDQYRDIDI